jgi:Tfp pilus assembly PilM family ATPase
MIKNIFLPEQIRGYFLFTQKIIGLSLQPDGVYASKISIHGYTITIEKHHFEPIEFSAELTYEENIVEPIKKCLFALGKYQAVYCGIPSALVTYKQLTLPFTDVEKIHLVLGHELEPSLPFKLEDAAIDFVVTQQDTKNKKTTIMAAITQKKYVNYYVKILTSAGIIPGCVVVDNLALYSLFKANPRYHASQEGIALIDLQPKQTVISYIQQGQIHLVRSITKGLFSFGSRQDVLLGLRFDQDQQTAGSLIDIEEIAKNLASFVTEIQYTFSAFQTQLPSFTPITKIVLTGQAAAFEQLPLFFSKKSGIATEFFDTKGLPSNKNFIYKKPETFIQQEFVTSTAIASPTATIRDFNFLTTIFKNTGQLLVKQIIVAACLFIAIFTCYFIYTRYQYRFLNNALEKSKNEIIKKLQEPFSLDKKDVKTAQSAVKKAQEKIKDYEELWLSFQKQSRVSYLENLEALSTTIDREGLGLKVNKISMKGDEVLMEGETKDLEALNNLKEALSGSPTLRNFVLPQSDIQTDFKTKVTKFKLKINVTKENLD